MGHRLYFVEVILPVKQASLHPVEAKKVQGGHSISAPPVTSAW